MIGWIPSAICVVVTGIWLLAGQAFFVDHLLPGPRHSDTWQEAAAHMELRYNAHVQAARLRGWMVEHLAYAPRESGRPMWLWAIGLVTHPFLHTGVLLSLLSIVGLATLGMAAEVRGGPILAGVVTIAALGTNAVVLAVYDPDILMAGCWSLMGAYGAMCIVGFGFHPGALVGLLAVAGLWFDVPGALGQSAEVIQWAPATAVGVLGGALSWAFGDWD